MEMREKPKDPNDPRECVAIHGGAPRAFLLLVVIPTLYVVVAAVCIYGMQRGPMVGAVIALGMLLTMTVVLVLLCTAVTDGQRVSVWLRAYWSRNVRGYVVAHYPEGGRARCSDPFPRGHERLDVFLNSYPFVILWPLGGWFPRPRAYWRAKQSWWSVARDTRFLGTPVKVTDKNGSSLRFAGIEDAMTFIAQRLERAATEPFWRDSSDMPFSWLQLLEGLAEDRDDARREIQRVREIIKDYERLSRKVLDERNAVTKERDEAVKFVDGLAQEIEQGSRLSGTIEALRLLDRMLNWLCWASVKDSPEHRAMQDRLAVVRGRLAEKQRRDRRRHGKGATAAT